VGLRALNQGSAVSYIFLAFSFCKEIYCWVGYEALGQAGRTTRFPQFFLFSKDLRALFASLSFLQTLSSAWMFSVPGCTNWRSDVSRKFPSPQATKLFGASNSCRCTKK
jgi:hypothetical protein